jgi:murein DD-endopeptidase MepM/ murein hydrolase activator NlpD
MTRRQWTLLVVSDGETAVRQYRFSQEVVRLGIACVFLVIAVLSSGVTTLVIKQQAPLQVAELHQTNELLKTEIKEIQSHVTSLNAHLASLADQDEQFRLVAGLEPLSPDVQRVGIGGPGGEDPKASELIMLDRDAGELAAATTSQVSELLRRARLLSFSWREAKDTLETKHERLLSTPSIVPTNGYVTSTFTRNRWHPILDRARPHQGVDITAPTGTPIVAAAKGTVAKVGYDGDYGHMIEIDHGYGVRTRYAHASKTLVRRGQPVKRGERIGLVGSTGLAVGPHLHYEVLVNGRPTNPRNYFLNTKAIAD